jgi:hypothetical protein
MVGMTFPSNPLEESLRDAAEGRVSVGEWLESLLAAQVWAPVSSADGGSGTFPVLSVDGGSYVAVFTSEEELSRAQPQAAYVVAPCRDLVQHLPAHVGVAVNPGGSLGLPLPAAELRRLVDQRGRIPAGSTVKVGEPAEEPVPFLGAASGELAQLPAVRAARRCWAAVDDNEPGLVLGVDIDPDSEEVRGAVLASVRRAASTSAYPGSVDVVFANDRDALTQWMHENVQPFHPGPSH